MDRPPTPDDAPCEDGWSDARFLELARDGGQDEAYRLLIAHFTKLRGFLTSRYLVELGGSVGVEEIVHEAAWKAIESVSNYRPERGGVMFWAWRIGVNHAMDRIRSEEARHARERAVARPEYPKVEELLHSVRETIAQLPEPFRTVLLFDLEHGEGCSAVLAQELQVEIQTIYNWRLRAHSLIAPLLR